MSRVTRKRCDHCRGERDEAATITWFHVTTEVVTWGEDPDLDFCSVGCLNAWSTSRMVTA